MTKPIPHGDKKVVFEGKAFEIVRQSMKIGEKIVEFEIARRAPGVRLLIVKNDKILLAKEYRVELGNYDYRLPGGRVFDRLKEYISSRESGKNILKFAIEAAKKESIEEAGLIVKDLELIHTTNPDRSVEWDLFYFLVKDFEANPKGQELEHGEVIEPEWKTFEEAKQMCLDKKIREDRSVAVLLRYLLK